MGISQNTIDEQLIIDFYLKTKNLKATSIYFHISISIIRRILTNNNIIYKKYQVTIDDHKDIINLYQSGVSARKIGKIYNIVHASIIKILRDYQIQIRESNLTNNKSHKWTGYGEISSSFLRKIQDGAKMRNHNFNLTCEEIWNLFLKQNRKCVFSGLELKLPVTSLDRTSGNYTASLDRIDNNKGYIINNVQWVHKKINIMKHVMTNEELINWCNLISDYNRKNTNESIIPV